MSVDMCAARTFPRDFLGADSTVISVFASGDPLGWQSILALKRAWFRLESGSKLLSCNHVYVCRYLYNNTFSGSIPSEAGKLTHLATLYALAPSLPAHICFTLDPPFILVCRLLHGNSFTGAIPDSFGNLTRLKVSTMQDNQLSGSVPPSIGKLTELKILYAKRFVLATFLLWHNLYFADLCQIISSASAFLKLFPLSRTWPSLMQAVLGSAVPFLSFLTAWLC